MALHDNEAILIQLENIDFMIIINYINSIVYCFLRC